ncbi:MAG: hypothetical protein R6X34_02525 [Chloroflexota bacterium]
MARLTSHLSRLIQWLKYPRHRWLKLSDFLPLTFLTLYLTYQAVHYFRFETDPRSRSFAQWTTGSPSARQDLVTVQRETCPGTRFILPVDGFIGLLYEDPREPYSSRNPHQGIDIFSNNEPRRSEFNPTI